MKTSRLAPLALLIPTVVLAQPALPQQPQGGMPPAIAMPAPPVNPAKAAAALNTAKELSSKLKGGSLSKEEAKCGSGYTTWSTGSGGAECLRT